LDPLPECGILPSLSLCEELILQIRRLLQHLEICTHLSGERAVPLGG